MAAAGLDAVLVDPEADAPAGDPDAAGAPGDAAGAAEAPASGVADAGLAPSASLAGAWPFLPWSRKSVTYQPLPLSWKAGAVNCLRKASAPQAGHTVSGASENFWITSLAWPQVSQR